MLCVPRRAVADGVHVLCCAHAGLEEMLDDLVLGEEEEVNVGEEAFDEEAEPTDGAPGPQKSGKKAAAARASPY